MAVKKKETEAEQSIKIPPIEKKMVRITLVGDAPLLVNRFD